MSHIRGSAFCKSCHAQVLTAQDAPNHILHLLLSVLTAGMWIPIWFLLAVLPGARRCTRCGLQLNHGSQWFAVLLFIVLVLGATGIAVFRPDRSSPEPSRSIAVEPRTAVQAATVRPRALPAPYAPAPEPVPTATPSTKPTFDKPWQASRKWTLTTGRTVEGRLRTWSKFKVVIVQADGKEIATNIDGLSPADQAWVDSKLQ